MRIVVVPDSFKGSLSAVEVCRAIEAGIRRVRDAEVVCLPMADGGEGTIDSLVLALGGQVREAVVRDPLGRDVRASYGVLTDGSTAVVELAQASGLPLLSDEERQPLLASTYGTGQLIVRCLDEGYRNIVLGLGGSATNDAGTGMLRALGVRFLDGAGEPLPEGGGSLTALQAIDVSGMDPRISETKFICMTDVRNPLCGDNGASRIFGPQKGASEADVVQLDTALATFAQTVNRQLGIDVVNVPGAGAAGGTGAGALALLGAELRPGFELLADLYGLDDLLTGANLVITGEGRLDAQTASGKVVAGVCARAAKCGVPVAALCGSVSLTTEEMDALGLAAALSIVQGPCTLDVAIAHAYEWTCERTVHLMRLVQAGTRMSG